MAILICSQLEGTPFWSRYPPTSAIRKAASLPLGSIIPQNRSNRQQSALGRRLAEVPSMEQARLEALTLISFGFKFIFSRSSRMATSVIILVRLAISRGLWVLRPQMERPSFISYRSQLLAVTFGGRSEKVTFCKEHIGFLEDLVDMKLSRIRRVLPMSTDFLHLGLGSLSEVSMRVQDSEESQPVSSFWVLALVSHLATGVLRAVILCQFSLFLPGRGGSLIANIFMPFYSINMSYKLKWLPRPIACAS